MFVQSAAGGVGSALVQLGLAAGLRVYGATSEAKQVLVAALGATPLNRQAEVSNQLRALEPDGVDLAFDAAGSSSADASLALVKPGGRVIAFGFMADVARSKLGLLLAFLRLLFWLPLRSRSRRFRFVGHVVDRMVKNPKWYRATLGALLDQVRTGQLKPMIGAEFPLEDLGRAQALLESGHATGKVVIRVAPQVARRPDASLPPG
jgi:NADPH:quinone reductase-like Zn-dependent oxidoreductase